LPDCAKIGLADGLDLPAKGADLFHKKAMHQMANPASGIDLERDGLPKPRRAFALATILMGVTLAVLDGTIANVALPTIAQDLHATAASSIWIVNAYQMAIVISLLPLASLGEILGYRRVYLGGVALFTLASVGCVLAPDVMALTFARAAQGFGAAGLMSVNGALLRYAVPKDRFGRALGVLAMTIAIASSVGPAFAGFALSLVHWSWLFAINLPLGVLTLALGWRSLPESHRAAQSFDWVSAGLSALTLGFFITTIDSLGEGLSLAVGVAEAAICLTALALLIRRERRKAHPLLPLDLLAIPILSLSLCTSVAAFTAQTMAFVSLPFTFQTLMGFAPHEVGLLMIPWPVALALVAPLSGRLSDRYSSAVLGCAGLAVLSVGLLALWLLPVQPDPVNIAWRMALCGLGFGLFQAPNNRTLIGSAPRARSGAASGLQSTARLTGQCIGAALVALFLAHLGVAGAQLALAAAATFAAIAAGVSLTRKGR
jgi:DHA2 family multidrug resistance protein-like MFS transporter